MFTLFYAIETDVPDRLKQSEARARASHASKRISARGTLRGILRNGRVRERVSPPARFRAGQEAAAGKRVGDYLVVHTNVLHRFECSKQQTTKKERSLRAARRHVRAADNNYQLLLTSIRARRFMDTPRL